MLCIYWKTCKNLKFWHVFQWIILILVTAVGLSSKKVVKSNTKWTTGCFFLIFSLKTWLKTSVKGKELLLKEQKDVWNLLEKHNSGWRKCFHNSGTKITLSHWTWPKIFATWSVINFPSFKLCPVIL